MQVVVHLDFSPTSYLSGGQLELLLTNKHAICYQLFVTKAGSLDYFLQMQAAMPTCSYFSPPF